MGSMRYVGVQQRVVASPWFLGMPWVHHPTGLPIGLFSPYYRGKMLTLGRFPYGPSHILCLSPGLRKE